VDVVVTVHSTPVAVFLAVTVAFESGAPALSRTLPRMLASTVCPPTLRTPNVETTNNPTTEVNRETDRIE